MCDNIKSQIKDLLDRLSKAQHSLTTGTTEINNIRNQLEGVATAVDLLPSGQCDEPAHKKIKLELENDYAVVYTAVARLPNVGIGVWWENEDPENVFKPTNNNSPDIQACTEACKKAALKGVKKLLIKTDTQFVVNCTTYYLKKWITNNWTTDKGTEAECKEDLLKLVKYSSKLLDVKYEFIPDIERDSRDSRGYEEANILARKGAAMN